MASASTALPMTSSGQRIDFVDFKKMEETMKPESTRITDLEIGLAHLQRQFELLDEVVTEQATRLDQANKRLEKFEEMLESVKASAQSPAEPIDEKPPHY